MDNNKLFGKRIKELRKKNGYTQEQLSEKLGVFQKQIGNIETGTCFTTMNNLEKLSDIFDVEIKDLFDFNHLENRDTAIQKINDILAKSSDEEVQKFYKIINAIKN
ncbi:MAG: helix-turn-helix domain-containing protein [Candidatus Gastranaerophilales bacterium]|nr:helix-turn-helix domain-containing protein [Candidatus Gastranaerophilales bacterium]